MFRCQRIPMASQGLILWLRDVLERLDETEQVSEEGRNRTNVHTNQNE